MKYGLWIILCCISMSVWAADTVKPESTVPMINTAPKSVAELLAVDNALSNLIEKARARAEDAAKQGDIDTAVAVMQTAAATTKRLDEIYKVYLSAHPDDYKAINYYGNFCADMLGDEKQALKLWRKALKLNPDCADAHNNLGTYYLHRGDAGRAMDEFRTAIKIEPKNPDYHFNIAQAYYLFRPIALEKYGWNLEQLYEHAMAESHRAVELKPNDYKLRQDYAISFFGAEQFGVKADWNAARRAWAKCRELAPDTDQKIHSFLYSARVELRAGKYKKAREFAQKALELEPNSKSAKRLIEMSLEKSKSTV